MLLKYQSLLGNQYAKGNDPNKTSFSKGNIPWNKGKKGIHLCPQSEFKKGQRSINWTMVGTIRIRIDKNKTSRKWIKVEEPNVWIEHSKFIWVKNRGNIPNGFLVHHIDKNALNDDILNLSLVTRAAHINLHREELNKAKT